MLLKQIQSALFGVAVGDALGVPAEGIERHILKRNPITEMTTGGYHCQPAGTWSDDSSLTFCLADNLTQDFDLNRIAQSFLKWGTEAHWTARSETFGMGRGTHDALVNVYHGIPADLCGGESEEENGNGSLMHILPLVFFTFDKNIDERFDYAQKVSSITHRHIRSVIACFYYLEFARYLLQGIDKYEIYARLQQEIPAYLRARHIDPNEIAKFNRLFTQNIVQVNENEIESSGYVLHTLEAAIWCLLNHNSFSSTVLSAVNLGGDSDTTAAVVGGLVGLIYGVENIPQAWSDSLARKEDIKQLCEKFFHAMKK